MGTTLYKEVSYKLKGLIEYIDLGEIALPELQRPFVWPKAKVRDLFDSMYKGYPVGFFLFWETSVNERKTRSIGKEEKQKLARLLVIDGQQRLTSLFAVMKSIEVKNKKGISEKIQIAFNPRKGKFEVSGAAVLRDPEYIHDISKLWSSETGKARFVKDFLNKLKKAKGLTEEDEEQISDAIDRLYNLEQYSFNALELYSSVDEEQVADVFVRINSKGKPLNQADFILTLMAVFWEDGRKKLEQFCEDARTLKDGEKSSFNYISRPNPDDLLRVIVGYGFTRGRLKYGYAVLRGKDLKTGETSSNLRDERFEKLKVAQGEVLNLTNWHEFLKVPLSAGFSSKKMVSSNIGLLFAYTLYLIGLKNFNLDRSQLRKLIAKWFFMGALTSRYTGSPESIIEKDIIAFKKCKSRDEFVGYLNKVINSELTEDYWNITLPNELATSSASSPSLHAYQATLCLLNARPLFSNLYLKDLFKPSQIRSHRSNVERHHLFPKNYLKTLKITGTRDTNQIANYAWIEWTDNINISDNPPSQYFPPLYRKMDKDERAKMIYWHALPDCWYEMKYEEFLEARRKLIAKVIRDGYAKIENL